MALPRKKHRPNPNLTPRTEAVLALLLEVWEEPLPKTTAVKLPYLVDVVAQHVLGGRITDATYEAWDHGVVGTEIYDLITGGRHGGEAARETPFEVENVPGYEDRQLLCLRGAVPEGLLTSEEEDLVEFVAVQYGRLSPSELGRLTKKMNPHVRRWPARGKSVHLGEDAYGALPVPFEENGYVHLARRAMAEIEKDPGRLVSQEEFEREMAEFLDD